MDPEEITKLRAMKAGLRLGRPKAYNLLIESASPLDGECSFYQLRLFPNRPGVHFEGRVHEQINFCLQRLGIPLENAAVRIRHTGYEDLASIKGKYERNWSIQQAEIAKNPDNVILHFHAARTLAGMNRHEEAINHIQKITENRLIQEKEKTFYLHAAIFLGKYFLQIKDFLKAQALFERLVKEYPDNPIVHYGLGESYYSAGDYAQACSPLRRSLSLPLEVTLFPVNIEKFVFDQFHILGQCYQQMGMLEQTQSVWKAYTDRNPGHCQTWELLGLLALENNQVTEAVGYFQEALRKKAVSDKIFANLGLCFRKLEKWSEAEENLQRALNINPERIEALINLGLLYYQQKDYRQALDYFNRALALDPHLVDVLLFMSDILAHSGEVEALVAVCDQLLELLHLDRELTIQSLRDLGELFFRISGALDQEGKPTLAIQALHVGFSLFPNQETMERIVAKAKEIGTVQVTLQRLEADLSAFKGSSLPA